MPGSAEEGRDMMLRWIARHQPRAVLDVGVGSGTYGRALRHFDPLPWLVGVEVWTPYVHTYCLTAIYDHLLAVDIRSIHQFEWPHADVIVFGDVLEHMPEKDALRMWDVARFVARKGVFLSIPIVPYPQSAEHGNPFEEHVVPDWTHERVLNTFPGIVQHWTGTIVGRYEGAPS